VTAIWTLTYNLIGGPPTPGSKNFDTESAFLSAVRDALSDLRKERLSAVRPDGGILTETDLRALVA